MNTPSKKIDVSCSSLVGLKAELARKREEFRKVKFEAKSTVVRPAPKVKKQTVWSKENSGVQLRCHKDIEELEEETNVFEKSRIALEAKTKLYEELSKSGKGDDYLLKEQFLVNFDNKNEKVETLESDLDEGWVEFIDCLGRTRKCLLEDLVDMKKNDDKLAQSFHKDKTDESVENPPPNLETEEPERLPSQEELNLLEHHKKWEAQEEQLRTKDSTHYQDVMFDEVRQHGVGYFEFSRDEAVRREQQKQFADLRATTEKQQQRAKKLQERRQEQQERRLEMARRRRRQQLGLAADDDSTGTTDKDSTDDTKHAGDLSNEYKDDDAIKRCMDVLKGIKRPAPKFESVPVLKTGAVRPWDIGKEGVSEWKVMSQNEWVEKKREERPHQFAPPPTYSYYEPTYSKRPNKDRTSTFSNDHKYVDQSNNQHSDFETNSPSFDSDHLMSTCFRREPPKSEQPRRDNRKGVPDLEDSIMAGLAYLRKQAEEKDLQCEKGLLNII